jgi:hypothetical protein
LSTRKLAVWITFLAIFAMSARISMDTDTWWHLRAGQWIVEHRQVLRVDEFSYTRAGDPWQYPGWLVEVPMYAIYRLFGPGGLNLWTALMVTLAFGFVWFTLSGGTFLRAFTMILAATASGVYWAARPYLVTFLCAAIFLWILESYRWKKQPYSKRLVWLLPVFMVIWANSHGGFIVGFILWGVYWISEVGSLVWDSLIRHKYAFELRTWSTPLLWSGILMIIGVCINPYGPVMLLYPFRTVQIGALRDYIQEWQSPDFHSLSVQPFAWLFLLIFAAVGASRRRLAFIDFILVAGFAYLGFLAGRNIALFAIVAPMALTRHAAPVIGDLRRLLGVKSSQVTPTRRSFTALNLTILIILIVAVLIKVATVYPLAVNEKVFQSTLPISAVDYLKREQPQGRLFNSYNWGGYLLWALPEYPVFVDGRTDLYNDEVIGDWLRIAQAKAGWQALLQQYGVNVILIEPTSPLKQALNISQDWEVIYQDQLAVLYERK